MYKIAGYLPVLMFLAVFVQGCSKEKETQAESPAESQFTLHLYIVPAAGEKTKNVLNLKVWVDGRQFSYTSKDNEIFHSMKVMAPSKVEINFEAKTEIPATFHFKAYQDEEFVWGGGSGCLTGSYSKNDKISFFK